MSVMFAPTSAEILGRFPIDLICFRPSQTADKVWDFRETVKSLIVFDFPGKWKPGLLIGTLDEFTYNRLIYFYSMLHTDYKHHSLIYFSLKISITNVFYKTAHSS